MADDINVGRIKGTLTLDDSEWNTTIDRAKAKLDDLTEDRTTRIRVDADTAAAMARIAELQAQLDRLRDQPPIPIPVPPGGGGGGGGSGGSSSSSSSKDVSALGSAAALIGPAVIPLAGLVAASAGAAALGLGSLALAVKGAKTEMADGTTVGVAYTAGIKSLQGDLSTLEKTAAAGALAPFQAEVRQATGLMPGLNAEVAKFAQVVGVDAVSATHGIVGGFQTLQPLFVQLGQDSEKLFASFDQYANGGGLLKFETWMQANLPGIEHDLEDVGQAFGKIVAAAAPVGVASLSSLGLMARAIDALPVGTLQVIVPLLIDGYVALQAYRGINAAVAGIQGAATAFKALRSSEEGAGLSMSAALGPIGAVAVGVGLLTTTFLGNHAAQQAITQSADSYAQALQQDSGALGDYTRAQVAKNLADDGALKYANALGISASTLTDAVSGNASAMDQVKAVLAQVTDNYNQAAVGQGGLIVNQGKASQVSQDQESAARKLSSAIGVQTKGLSDAEEKQKLLNEAMLGGSDAAGAASVATQTLARRYGETVAAYQAADAAAKSQAASALAATQAMQQENDAAGLLKQGLDALNGRVLNVDQAQTALGSATLALDSTLKQNKSTTDINTTSGVANRQAIEQAKSSLDAYEEAVAKNTGSSKQATAAYNANAQQLLDNIGRTDGVSSATYAYAQQLLGIGKIKVPPTKIDLDDAAAAAALAAFRSNIFSLANVVIPVKVAVSGANLGSAELALKGYASGGTITGPGGPTSDSVPIMASAGEEVTPAPQAAKYRPLLKAIAADKVPGYATGGTVGTAASRAALATARANVDFTISADVSKVLGAGTLSAVQSAVGSLITAVHSGLSKGIGSEALVASLQADNSKISALSAQRATDYATLSAATAKLAADETKYTTERDNVAGAVTGGFDITSLSSGSFDAFGGTSATGSVSDAISALQARVASAGQLNTGLATLKKLGLSPALIQQLGEAGVSGGGAAVAELAGASKAQIAQINALSSQINTYGSAAGNQVAGSLFGSTIAADAKAVKAAGNKVVLDDQSVAHMAAVIANQISHLGITVTTDSSKLLGVIKAEVTANNKALATAGKYR